MKFKNYLLTFAYILSCIFAMTYTASAQTVSGRCGTSATWSLNESGVLTISGSGDMTDFSTTSKVEWSSYRNEITKVVIEEGITSIGKNSFRNCYELNEVSLPQSLEVVGVYAFRDCISLESITIPDEVTIIDESAFRGCEALSSIKLSENLLSIGSEAFAECVELKQITLPKSVKYIDNEIFTDC